MIQSSLLPLLFNPSQWNWIPVFIVLAWGFLGLMVWTGATFIRDTARITQRMHRIPCSHCRFFTGDYHLKCTVRPIVALTESAIHCTDFQA